jgi:hypothetical protein
MKKQTASANFAQEWAEQLKLEIEGKRINEECREVATFLFMLYYDRLSN